MTATPPFHVRHPLERRSPVVVASPHSGSAYPEDLVEAAQLDASALRQSEDCFVDQLFEDAIDLGIPTISALFPRAYVDVNREPWELDPAMFEDELPAWVNSTSPRVMAGLGTLPRVVADGQPIYRSKLPFAEARRRVETYYFPYHDALEALVAETVSQFGLCILVDAHSMPSTNIVKLPGASRRRVDFVLGDRQGTSCHPLVTETAESALRALGYVAVRNSPYAGGFTTGHYGRPELNRHCLQLEISRDIYMDERSYVGKPGLKTLKAQLRDFLMSLDRAAEKLSKQG